MLRFSGRHSRSCASEGPVFRSAAALFGVACVATLLTGMAPAKSRPAAARPAEPLATFGKFPDWVTSIAFSPDGKLIAAGSYGVVKLFDTASKAEIASWPEPAGFVKALAFSPDGSRLASTSYQTVTLREIVPLESAASANAARVVKGHRGYVTGADFSPDGKLLATCSEDETIRLWDPVTGEERRAIIGLSQPALGVRFAHNGEWLAVCTGDATRPTKKGAARIYDVEGQLRYLLEGHERVVSALAFSPDDSTLATGSADEMIKLWNTSDGKELRTLEGHSRPVNSLAYFPDGRTLASAGGGRNAGGNDIKLWDLGTGKVRGTISAHDGPVLNVTLTSDGRLLASSSVDKTVKLWDAIALVDPAAAEQAAKARANTKAPVAANAEEKAEAKTEAKSTAKPLRVGMIGLDTSHCVAFTQILNAKDAPEDVSNCVVVAAYPKGSPDIPSSTKRVPEYTEALQKLGVEIVDSIDALVQKVDVVLLETNDGRPHFEQVLPVLKAGKPVFIDKPIAGSLADAVAIFEAGRKYKTPLFSSSSLRYAPGAQALRGGKIGEIKGCDAYSPCALEATHPDLFWYGIHGVESLFTVMGPGCESVTRTNTPAIDLAVGVWQGGRVGTFRGVRTEAGGGQSGYGGTAFGTKGIEQIGPYGGYRPLVVEIVKFFRTGQVPVSEQETLEIYAFMEAADESKRLGGAPVRLETVLKKAREVAEKRLTAN